ncbi:MAG: tetratricopeptide repeat protein, partial [Candidatus Nitrosotenuis sp.]|nr:tetratricopeptide repeat protein [Candidatus Nitrosotenuis sp.]
EPRQEPARQIEPEPRITDNLSVEDKQLGIMLNEITLNCDASELADSIAYYDGMGPALMRLCKYDQAISYFDKALIENPERAEIYANKGAALSKMGQYEMAIAYYESALEIDPEYMPALNNKANALVHLGEIDKAITVYNSILEDDPTFSVAQNNLEKARAKYVELHKDETEKPEPVKIEHPQKIVQEPPEIKYTKQKEEKSIFDQIGSAFSAIGSGLFGFLS